jgi:hypothetical protein
MLTRRQFSAALALACSVRPALAAASLPMVRVWKDPNCGCCGGWVDHLKTSGFAVEVTDTAQVNRVKRRLGIPHELWACHTAEVGRYVVEGHVPARAIERLLREEPAATGLAVPGMPIGSPGMEVEGSPPEEYTVVLFGTFGQKPYGRYKADLEVSKG